jgi:phage baseplate assembly protein W
MTTPTTSDDPDAAARAVAEADYANAVAGLLHPDWPDGHAPSDPYGIALSLIDGDLVMARGVDGWRDLVTIAGTDELSQGLQVLIGTPLGTDLFNRSLGFDLFQTLAQPKALREIRELIRLCVVKALAQEPRIRQIQVLAFADEPAYLTIHPELTPDQQASLAREQVSTRRWKLDALLDTRLGDQVTAGIQGVGP